ncbi:MAG: protein kinase [Myxococcales bacterium]|nr:protein kinase [Myxococcales bacterium]
MTSTLNSWIGTVLAERYRLDALLGHGGMGAVFEAFDATLQRTVAVKVVLPERVTDAEAVARFLREARSAAAIANPGIITVHDVGQAATAHGTIPFLVMERLRGEPLAARLKRGPLSVDEARSLAVDALEALALAHDAGIVHRDIKPDNVFLRAPHGKPTILDFGIATMSEGSFVGAQLTREGQSLGTPVYMAPEQLLGERVGPAADLYAMGALLYEAVTGRPPHMAETYPALIHAKLSVTPDPTPLLARAGDGPFASTVLAALSRAPSERPESARTMAHALGSLGQITARGFGVSASLPVDALASTEAHDTPSSVPTPAPVQALTTASQSSVGTSALGRALLVLLPLALLGGTVAWLLSKSPRGRGDAPTDTSDPASGAQTAQARPTRTPTLALGVLRDFHEASGAARALLESAEVWEQCNDDFALALGEAQEPSEWVAGQALCDGFAKLLRGESAEALLRCEVAVFTRPEWADARVPLAEALFSAGRTDDAVAALRAAIRLDPSWWVPHAKLASLYARAGEFPEAIQAYRRAREVAPSEARIIDALAMTYHAAELDQLADEAAAEAIALDPEVPWAHLILAERALERDDGEAALAAAERTLASHPASVTAVLARADALALLGRDDSALRAYAQFLTLVGDSAAEATGVPVGRVELVRDAIARDELPASRTQVATTRGDGPRTTASAPRTRSTGSSRAAPRSAPRSAPADPLGGLDF